MNIDRITMRHGSNVESAQSKPKITAHTDQASAALIPSHFDFRHALAYAHLNFHQIANENGLTDISDTQEDILGWQGLSSHRETKAVCDEVIAWSQTLRPREVQPAMHALLGLIRCSLNEAEQTYLLDGLRTIAVIVDDCAGEVKRYMSYLDCLFMTKRRVYQGDAFFTRGRADASFVEDPLGWTTIHDLTVIAVYLNNLRAGRIDDNDEFNLRMAIENWIAIFGGNEFENLPDSLDLLHEVDHELFPPESTTDSVLARVSKSHENLVNLFFNMEVTSAAMTAAITEIYEATYANVFLTSEQKLRLKELVLFWHQHMDLARLIGVIESAQPDGRGVLRVLDAPIGRC